MTLWTCQRVTEGVKCGWKNPARKRKCLMCGKHRPPKRKPAHHQALEVGYGWYVIINRGEHCAICGREPTNRKLDRDHDHKTGKPRGLLCVRCNRALPNWVTASWLRAAADYLDRAEERAA